MGRAEERRARQRGGHRAAPRPRRSSRAASPAGPAGPVGHGRRRTRPGASGKTGVRRLFTWRKILGTFLGLCLLGIGGFILLYLLVPVPEGNAAAKLQSNVYKYANGTVLAREGEVNREVVDLAKVPKDVQRTFVAAENKTFYQDNGVDLKGTARGLLNTLSGKGAQGGSTITQQYVKNYYLSQEQTVTRKLKELVISLKVDRRMSKDDILAGYINTSYYGRNAYGIQAAAQAYYRVDADELTVEQGAYLAALLQAPSQYDWAVASQTSKRLAKNRWHYVLDNMVEEGWLNASERRGMTFPVPKEPQGTPGMEGQTGYLVDAANAELARQLVAQGAVDSEDDALAMVKRGGWTMTVNIDKKKQNALEKAAEEQLTSKLDPEKRKVDANIQPGAVSVDPKTGKIVAMYGGVDYLKHYRNNATRRDYQPASTFKPVILAAAVEDGAETQDGEPITANTGYDGDSRHQVVDNGDKVGFAPPNEDDVDYGDVTVQTAMNKSINSVFAQMGVDVGMDEVMEVAGRLGMDTDGMEAVPAQTLGSMGASPLEMAGIYATLDNHGKKVTPAILASAEHKDTVVDLPDPVGDQVISREAADTVTSVLTGVVDDGTARASVRDNPERQGQQVAGKTGTSDYGRSAWFTGYTPNLVTSVGLFGEDAKTGRQVNMAGATGTLPGKGRVNGGGFPAQIWAAYTFGVMDEVTKFDLDTDQGAAVKPSYTPTPTLEPTTQAPTSEPPTSAPPTSQSPTRTPTGTPSQTPTQSPSQTPTTQPPTSTPTDGTTPENPLFPDSEE
ncbi:transglycosylase domain-containing protein [Streptomyces chromofuscus]|uniref:Penicillin-binding protein n=1 Tax=Streptomyces chromofuscus TaxID=42881 RepID=A0A7M2T4U2_STRCW|nr:transglycosylase domain-containing protein [Streptomyces chromofuscus]QOV42708.1 penicillin-binding protein [Streptomyces chromofuscus]GGS90118.1 penicillin-binding protein [Streptomyces chromofuscus]